MARTAGVGFGSFYPNQEPKQSLENSSEGFEHLSTNSAVIESERPSPDWTADQQLKQLWESLQEDADQQAVVCAEWCLAYAPALASWLKARIYAALSDQQLKALALDQRDFAGRLRAITLLGDQVQPAPQRSPATLATYSGYSPSIPYSPKETQPQLLGACLPVYSQTHPLMPSEIRVDPELGRVCIALQKATHFRLYVIGRELTRSGDGSGKITKQALFAALDAYGIHYTATHRYRLLRAGDGLFWNLSRKHLYLRNPGYVGAKLAEEAPALFNTNRPGVRDVYLSPRGSLECWEGMVYAGWMAHRENPTIARETLEGLFGRSHDTLQRWEKQWLEQILTVRANYCQCPDADAFFYHIPDHRQTYVANVTFQGHRIQVTRLSWQMPNTYQVTHIRQHPHRGQASKVRNRVNDTLADPADPKRGGMQPTKRYFDDAKRLKAYADKHEGFTGYLWRGESHYGVGLFEINRNGFWQTSAHERATWKDERHYFQAERQRRQAWLKGKEGKRDIFA